METYIITKEDIGRTLFAIPMGNYVCRSDNPRIPQINQVKTITISRVGSKYITLENGSRLKLNFNGKTYQSTSDNNAGYVFFETMEEINKVKVVKDISHKLRDNFSYSSDWEKVPHGKLVQIAEILDIQY